MTYEPRHSGRSLTPDTKGTILVCPDCGEHTGHGFILIEDPKTSRRPWSMLVQPRREKQRDSRWKARPPQSAGQVVAGLKAFKGALSDWPLTWSCSGCGESLAVTEADAPRIGLKKKIFVVHRASEVQR